MPLPKRWATAPFVLLLLLVTTFAYFPGLSGGFIFDDYSNIVKQEKIQATSLTLDSIGRAASALCS